MERGLLEYAVEDRKRAFLLNFCVWKAGVKKNVVLPKIKTNHIERFSPYRAVNTLRFHCKKPAINGL